MQRADMQWIAFSVKLPRRTGPNRSSGSGVEFFLFCHFFLPLGLKFVLRKGQGLAGDVYPMRPASQSINLACAQPRNAWKFILDFNPMASDEIKIDAYST